jgi:hypothetical protein
MRLHFGLQTGVGLPYGVTAIQTFYVRGRPRFDVDVLWEPSALWQSYSAGFAYHVADRMYFLGARVRLLQLHPPWSRGYQPGNDNHLGLGLEAGIRAPVGPGGRLLVLFSLGFTGLVTESQNLSALIGLNLGLAWGAWSRVAPTGR